jgi:hypothetical protein
MVLTNKKTSYFTTTSAGISRIMENEQSNEAYDSENSIRKSIYKFCNSVCDTLLLPAYTAIKLSLIKSLELFLGFVTRLLKITKTLSLFAIIIFFDPLSLLILMVYFVAFTVQALVNLQH